MKLVFLGPPGVGKGTIADMVCKKYGIPHISTGDIFRENIKQGTELGKKAKEFMDKGELVTDEIVVGMVADRIKQPDCSKGFVFDGFPRTIPQAEALSEIVEIDHVVDFTATQEVILSRLGGRRTCRKCGAIYHIVNMPPKVEGVCDKCGGELYVRADEKPEVIEERLKVYENQTAPLTGFYKEKGLLREVDASPTPDEIFKSVLAVIE